MELKRVVITGLGAITPIGKNINELWENLKNGVSGSDLITRFDTEKFKTKFACEVKNYDAIIILTGKNQGNLILRTVCPDCSRSGHSGFRT
jgi:3-oxoacyl-(acyl-carrier-protein) synthase